MPYTHFRFIAYEVPTATRKNGKPPVKSGFPAGLACDPVGRIPVDPNTSLDAQIRLRRLAAAVDRAATSVATQMPDDANTLKIFMAPEFYFRPPGFDKLNFPNETYPTDQAMQIFEQLELMFLHADFERWLIVPGTVMWNFKDHGYVYRNTAIYIPGGQRNSATLIEKEVPSHIDGVPNPYKPGNEAYDPYLEKVFADWEYRKRRVFDIGGVPCGLEVCLDHADANGHRALKTVLADWQRMEKTSTPRDVSLHLLTAGGMPIEDRSVAARHNGYILRNDGYSDYPHSELRRIEGYTRPVVLNGIPQPGVTSASPWDLRGTAKLSNRILAYTHLELRGNELVPMFGNGYDEFPQRLIFYPPQPLP